VAGCIERKNKFDELPEAFLRRVQEACQDRIVPGHSDCEPRARPKVLLSGGSVSDKRVDQEKASIVLSCLLLTLMLQEFILNEDSARTTWDCFLLQVSRVAFAED
jgi:hypothetical protein